MYDVMAVGNALVDHEYILNDAALDETQLVKGNMTLATLEEQQQLLAYFPYILFIFFYFSIKKASHMTRLKCFYRFSFY